MPVINSVLATILQFLNTIALRLFRVGFVHLLPGVTGSGTQADPYTGWHTAVSASAAGVTWFFCAGYFYTPVEVRIVVDHVSLRGVAPSSTFIVGGDNGANKAVIRYAQLTNADNQGVTISDMTIDGGGVVAYGLILRNVNFSTFENLRIVNNTSWAIRTSRGITNVWTGIRISYHDMTFITPNGIYLGDGPGPYPGEAPGTVGSYQDDYYTTCSTFTGIEIAGLPGTGLEIAQSFSNVFNGGAVEVCGVALKLHASTSAITFNGTDLELALNKAPDGVTYAAGIQIDGVRHRFIGVNWIGSDVVITGPGYHVLETWFGGQPNSFTSNATGPVEYNSDGNNTPHAPFGTLGTGKVFQRIGRRVFAQGTNFYDLVSADNGGATALRMQQTGVAEFCIAHVPSNGHVYVARHGGLADTDYDHTHFAGIYALDIFGRDVTIGGILGAGSLNVSNTGNVTGHITSSNGAGIAALQLFVTGSIAGDIVQFPAGPMYFSTSGGYDTTSQAANEANFWLKGQSGRPHMRSLPPANAGATGKAGAYSFDAGFFYVCVADNTWKRVAIATW